MPPCMGKVGRSVTISGIGMILSGQLGAMLPDRGDQFSRRDLITHLTLNSGLARVDIDQQ